ncbi:MAG: hypothetical protein AB8A46_03455 [Prochlorococcus sp.]
MHQTLLVPHPKGLLANALGLIAILHAMQDAGFRVSSSPFIFPLKALVFLYQE